MHHAAAAALLSTLAGQAFAGLQTFDVSLGFTTDPAFGAVRVILNQGLPTETISAPASLVATGNIDLRVDIQNSEITNISLLGGSWMTTAPVNANVNDDGTPTQVMIDGLGTDFGAAESILQFSNTNNDGFSFTFRPEATATGNIQASQNGQAKRMIDLDTEQGSTSPAFNGFVRLVDNQLVFISKFRFSGSDLDAGLESGKTLGYLAESEISATVQVPTPGALVILGLGLGIATRRRR